MDEKKRKERENGKSGFACFCITVFDELWYLVKLNLLFLVGCVPIVTIPMAFTAALRVTSLLAQERRLPLWQTFRKAYLGEWKRALPCGWAFALLQALAGFGVFAYGMMMQENPLALLPLVAALVIFAVLAVAGLYFHSMLEQGIYLPPSQFETNFLSLAHSPEDIQKTIDAAAALESTTGGLEANTEKMIQARTMIAPSRRTEA